MRGSMVMKYGTGVLPNHFVWTRILDVQVERFSSPRCVLVAFDGSSSTPGTVGVYIGP